MRKIVIAAVAAFVLPGAAAAQSTAQAGCKSGELTRVRLSKIKSGGTMAGFNQAVAAHTAWYKSHGLRLTQRIAPVLVTTGGRLQVSHAEVMTFSSGDNVPREKHDAAWAAFVAKYRANSVVEKETIVCMPS
jgi:hypothetical protein